MSKLGRFCDGMMEACWLAAALCLPVFFDVHTRRSFEPDKVLLLRSLALLLLAAWLVKLVEQGRANRGLTGGMRGLLRFPLAAPILAFGGVLLLSTVLSVAPRVSFLGDYYRLQGAYTILSYIIIFAALAVNLGQPRQVERLVSALILSSLPVSLYGILQHFGLDTISWGSNVYGAERVTANMGNPIFVAAYLIMATPLTLIRLVQTIVGWSGHPKTGMARFGLGGLYLLVLVLQTLVIFFSGSRGPFLGWGVSLVVLFLLLCIYWRKRTLALVGMAGAALVMIGLAVLYLPGTQFNPLNAGNFKGVLESSSFTTRSRELYWQMAADIIKPHDPLQYPDGSTDVLNSLRPLIGYGPETMSLVSPRFYLLELTDLQRRFTDAQSYVPPDRSHNETWDVIVTGGLLGLAAYLWLAASIFYFSLKWMGQIGEGKQRLTFWGLAIGGGLAAGGGMAAWQGIGYLGVALAVGMVLGMLVFLGWRVLRPTRAEVNIPLGRFLLLAGIFAALCANFVEINFGIAVAVTRTYFWVYMGILLLSGFILPEKGENSENVHSQPDKQSVELRTKHKKQSRKPAPLSPEINSGVLNGVLAGLLLVSINFTFIGQSSEKTTLQVLWDSFTHIYAGQEGFSILPLAAVLGIWVIACVVFNKNEAPSQSGGMKKILISLFVSGLVSLVYGLYLAGTLARLNSLGIQGSLEEALSTEVFPVSFYIYVFLIVVFLGMFFARKGAGGEVVSPRGWAAAVVLFMVALLGINLWNLDLARADVDIKVASQTLNSAAVSPATVAIMQRATIFAPREDVYFYQLGRAELLLAQQDTQSKQYEEWMKRAEKDLQTAKQLNPLNANNLNQLAMFYSQWAASAQQGNRRAELGDQATRAYQQATMISPSFSELWTNWAYLNMTVLDQTQQAYQLIQRARQVDPMDGRTMAFLGDYYMREAGKAGSVDAQNDAYISASKSFEQALLMGYTPMNTRLALADLYTYLGDYINAGKTYKATLKIAPQELTWKIEEKWALMLLKKGDKSSALQHARNAQKAAPPEAQAEIQDLLKQVSS